MSEMNYTEILTQVEAANLPLQDDAAEELSQWLADQGIDPWQQVDLGEGVEGALTSLLLNDLLG